MILHNSKIDFLKIITGTIQNKMHLFHPNHTKLTQPVLFQNKPTSFHGEKEGPCSQFGKNRPLTNWFL